METVSKCLLTDAEKDVFIATLTPNLIALRNHAEISQEELANLIGVSRQTYSAIERKVRRMSWSTYLSLVLFFDNNPKTHNMLRALTLFPKELFARFNDGVDYSSFRLGTFLGDGAQDIIDQLDDQARHTIRSIVMVEFARCTKLADEGAVKAFGGMSLFDTSASDRNIAIAKALKAIQESTNNDK